MYIKLIYTKWVDIRKGSCYHDLLHHLTFSGCLGDSPWAFGQFHLLSLYFCNREKLTWTCNVPVPVITNICLLSHINIYTSYMCMNETHYYYFKTKCCYNSGLLFFAGDTWYWARIVYVRVCYCGHLTDGPIIDGALDVLYATHEVVSQLLRRLSLHRQSRNTSDFRK